MAVFHPSLEQVYDEAVRVHRNIEELWKHRERPATPEPTLDDIRLRKTTRQLRVDELLDEAATKVTGTTGDAHLNVRWRLETRITITPPLPCN